MPARDCRSLRAPALLRASRYIAAVEIVDLRRRHVAEDLSWECQTEEIGVLLFASEV